MNSRCWLVAVVILMLSTVSSPRAVSGGRWVLHGSGEDGSEGAAVAADVEPEKTVCEDQGAPARTAADAGVAGGRWSPEKARRAAGNGRGGTGASRRDTDLSAK